MTAAALNKNIEKVFKDLTPKETAKYLSDEWWRICEESTTGKDISSKMADLQRFEQKYVMTMNARDYITYVETLWELDVVILGAKFMQNVLGGYTREAMLLSALIKSQERVRHYVSESTTLSQDKKSRTLIEIDDTIVDYQKRLDTLYQECQDLISRDFWDRRGIPRPIPSNTNGSAESDLRQG